MGDNTLTNSGFAGVYERHFRVHDQGSWYINCKIGADSFGEKTYGLGEWQAL